tara:strand:+ start:1946 stop:3241 length:1296 start_codon:yes stop_codon:yes gene_type:complete
MSQAPPAKRRKKTTGNPNQHDQVVPFDADQVKEAIARLKSGDIEVAIIDAGAVPKCPGLEMVRFWNARAVPKHRVPVPRNWSDIDAKACKGLPGINGGMWHAYATTAHDFALDSPVVDAIFTETTGTSDWKIRPNRMRFNPVNKDDGYKAAHIEGPNVLSDHSGVSAIVCVTPGRTFTYYKGSNNDPRARQIFQDMGGKTSLFVQPTQAQLAPWPRTTIRTTKPGQIILFADSVAHEISRIGKNSLSLFLSPYDPAKAVSEVEFYAGLNRKQAICKKKAERSAPPLPTTLMLPGQRRQHPKEYFGLTRRQTEIFGSLFHSTGSYWPSDKPTFFLMHMMAFNAFKPKLAPWCFDENGKYNYEVITPELVSQDPNFDQSYFEKLPLANVSEVEIASMKAKFTGIPESAWDLIRYWTKDPRKCSENVAVRRGYI